MIKQLLSLSIVAFLIGGCSKKDTPDVYATEKFPQRVILVVDNPNDDAFYDYLSGGVSVVIRQKVERTDEAVKNLYSSSHAIEAVWIAHLHGNYVYFQLESDTSKYLTVVRNSVQDTELMLFAGSKGFGQEYLFDRHHLELNDGVRITTMESVAYPDNYFTYTGVVASGNAVKLNPYNDPAAAVKIRWYVRQL